MAHLYDVYSASFELSGSNGLIEAVIRVVVIGLSMTGNSAVVGLLAPVLGMTLMQAKTRLRQRWFAQRKKNSAVGEALAPLADDYIVVDDIALPQGKGTLGHLVIGPNGLFAIEANDNGGEIKCEGYECYVDRRRIPSVCRHAKNKATAVRNSIAEQSTRKEESPFVLGVVVLTNPGARTKLHQPAVPVLRIEELVAFIRGYQPGRYARVPRNVEEMRAIVDHLRSSRPKPAVSGLLTFLRL